MFDWFFKNKWRRGVFMVVYRKNKDKIEFLIQKRKLHWKGYEFPKGGIEKCEDEEETVRREVLEETGLKILKLTNHKLSGKYLYEKRLEDRPHIIGQTWKLYSAEVGLGKVKIDKNEHYGYEWLLYKDAKKKLTWDNQKKCLDVVWNKIKKN